MVATIQINKRGNLTLPKSLRSILGIENGGVVMAESTDKGIMLKAAVAFPVEIYSDARIQEFDAADKELALHIVKKRKKDGSHNHGK